MATKAKVDRQLINHRTVARACDIDTETLRAWIETGDFPEPIANIQKTMLYDKATIEHFLATGQWLAGTRFRSGVGKGRAN